MISPRVLFHGNPVEAVKYVGMAKKFAVFAYEAGIISKVWRVTSRVSIRVVNNIQANICKVWIEAKAGMASGYQFYTTSPTPQWATYDNPDTDFFPGGSAIYVPYPKVQVVNGEINYSQAVIKAYPTGSLVEEPPIVDGSQLWRYLSMPNDLDTLNQLMASDLFKVDNAWQVNGFTEGRYYSKVITPEEEIQGLVRPAANSLFHSYVQGGGQVHGCGAYNPIEYTYFTDLRYDAAPASMPPGVKKLNGKAPDTDWFGKACLHSVTSQDYGTRLFVIASAYDGVWHCYPLNAEQDLEAYTAQYAAYGDQAYKSSVVPEQAKSYTPAYPSWVCPRISWRDSYLADADRSIFEPCYSWSFNQNGSKAISVMVERKVSESTYNKISYYQDDLGAKYHEMRMALSYETTSSLYDPKPLTSPWIPTEEEIDPLELDPSAREGGTSDPKEIQIDRRGCVELEFIVEITGPGLGDFDFSIGVTKNLSPDSLDALEKGALVDVAYAMPLNWNIEDTQSFGELITNKAYSTTDIVVDDILSVWTELYRHEDQIGLVNAYDGEVTLNVPSKAKARFYKGDFSGMTELFCIPLSQSHGDGYTRSLVSDPNTLPSPPHLFVRNTNRSFDSLFPWEPEEGESEELYYYSTKITHLDLKSLSFYCTVRLLQQRRGELEEDGHWCNIINSAKKYCAVCVMGKIVDESVVGNPIIPDSWLRGWLYEAGDAVLDDGEELTPIDFKHNLRGIGSQARNEGFQNMGGVNVPFILYVGNQFETYDVGSWINTRSSVTNPEYNSVGVPQVDEQPVSPWWLTGPCGHVFAVALRKAFVKAVNGGEESVTVFESWGYGQGISVTDSQSPAFNFLQIETNFSSFLSHVYDLWGTEWYRYETTTTVPEEIEGTNPPEFALVSHYKDFGQHNQLQQWYASNPFVKANPTMSKNEFIASLDSSYCKKIIHYVVQAYINEPGAIQAIDGGATVRGSLPLYVKRNMFVLPRGGGFIIGAGGIPGPNYNGFTEFLGADYLKLFRNGYTVRDLKLGSLYYNSAITNHFTCDELEFTSAILITPEGHISYCKKDLYEIKIDFCSQKVWYENYYLDPEMYPGEALSLVTSSKKTPKFYRIENVTDELPLSHTDIDWKSVDGVSWYYNNVKTKHIYLYNLAYQRTTGDARKKSLQSGEEYFNEYTEEMFKPDFRVSLYSGFRWIYPFIYDDGQPVTLDRMSLPVGDISHFTALALHPNHDPRPKKTFLRLSPLFF